MPNTTKARNDSEPVNSDKKALQHATEMRPLESWQAIGIGTLVGILATLAGELVFASTFHVDLHMDFAFAGWELLFSIVGAMIGKSKRKTWRATWIGAIIGALSPVLIVIIGMLCLFLIAGPVIT